MEDSMLANDVERLLTVAGQQLRVSGNVNNAILALEHGLSMLVRADRPRFSSLQRAISADLDRLRGVELLRRGDDDGIDLGEHLGVVSETGGDGVSGEDAFAQGGVQLAKGGDAGAGVGVQAGEVGQAALADDSNAKVMAHQDIYL